MPKGIKGFQKGQIFTKEHRHRISLAKLGSKLSEEHKIKIGLTNKVSMMGNKNGLGSSYWKGKSFSQDHKNKLRLAKLGKPSPIKGRSWKQQVPRSLATRELYRQARLKQVIPNKDTSIEIKLQNFLKEQGIEFVTHYPILGQPDIFIKPNICIFADGCYWHKCPDCGFGHGRERDVEVTKELQKQNYIVIRLWEHEINNSQKNFSSKITQTIQ